MRAFVSWIPAIALTVSVASASLVLPGSAAAQDLGPPAPAASPGAVAAGTSAMVPYILQLPAGVSLISSPLDIGSGLAIDGFIGLDGEVPLLFEWDSSTQRFLDPEYSMLWPGAGYWYYTPTPSALLMFGKPYRMLTHLTRDIVPGWHLFGVPFTTGIDWSDLHLYASGNPIGLETARALGWIGSDVLTMQGSRWEAHPMGAPFKPGVAYWIRTTVPLSLRAQPAAPSLPGTVGSLPDPIDVIVNEFVEVIDNKGQLIETGEDIKAGKLTSGGFSGAGAVFSLANMLVQTHRYNTIMDELNSMDDKVDDLMLEVGAIESQVGHIEAQIDAMQEWLVQHSRLSAPQDNAEGWIREFWSDQSQTKQSYNWGRWKLAGCEIASSSCANAVTDETTEDFKSENVKFPDKLQPDAATDNFFLWWAYATAGGSKVPTYTYGGYTARNLVGSLYDGMTKDARTSDNGLRAYMEYVFSKSPCALDVTAAGCDLYSQVYLPVEAKFQQLIADQVMLVQAIDEALAVLASTDQVTHSYDSGVSDYMAGFQQQLSEETEAFVQTAEQIALYRAGDGRFDWSTFNTSDAAQLLARADFLAARLVGSPTGKPWPWPPGVTGRIFYTEQQSLPANTAHKACITFYKNGVPYENCATLPEAATATTVDGSWPYLQWSAPDANYVVTGKPTTTWKVQRLAPQPLAAGTYEVASVNPQYGNASLVVSQYGDDYSNPPAPGKQVVLYGSFNNVEGSLGVGALGANRTYAHGGDDSLHDFTITPSPNYTQVSLAYKYASAGSEADWYEKIRIKVVDDAVHPVFGAYPYVKVFWPNTFDVALGEYVIETSSICTSHYYQEFQQSLKMLKADGDLKSGVYELLSPCGTHAFGRCNYSSPDRNGDALLVSSIVPLDHTEVYTLQAHFHDKVYGKYTPSGYTCKQGPTTGSHVTWTVFNPTVVLVKSQ